MLETLSRVMPSVWVVWMTVVFLAIAVWAFWPANRQRFDAAARLPLDASEHDL